MSTHTLTERPKTSQVIRETSEDDSVNEVGTGRSESESERAAVAVADGCDLVPRAVADLRGLLELHCDSFQDGELDGGLDDAVSISNDQHLCVLSPPRSLLTCSRQWAWSSYQHQDDRSGR